MGKYTRKSNRKLLFTEALLTDCRMRLENGESKRHIAESIGANEATLRKRLKLGTVPLSLGRFKPVFSLEIESQLVQYCKDLDNTFYGLSIKSLREVVFEFAERNQIAHRFNVETKMAGKDWVKSFCKRHNLSARVAEKTSLARAAGFNEVQVKKFFDNLEQILSEKKIPATRIYNMDESGILTVPNKIPKVIAPKGKKAVGKIVSAERGQLVTAVCCLSAGGKYVPPALIFPRKRKKDELLNGAPAETLLLVSDSGYINTELFLEWLDHFRRNEKPSIEDPILLVLDNHASHISLDAINKCRDYGIHLLSLPPHTSHRLQPLDRGFFGPLKTAYGQECEKWHVSHPGRSITQFQIAQLFGQAYTRVASIEKCTSSFRACGIWPFNPDIFSAEDFAPASVTDRPLSSAPPPNLQTVNESTDSEDDVPLVHLKQVEKVENRPSTSREKFTITSTNSEKSVQNDPPNNIPLSEPSNSKDVSLIVSPQAIRPYPKAEGKAKQSRKSKKSEILTESPYKNELQKSQMEKRNSKGLKTVKRKVNKDSEVEEKSSLEKKKKEKDQIRCPRCYELYLDPPEVDWIQCSSCSKWYHEDCTVYAGLGIFTCDTCEDN